MEKVALKRINHRDKKCVGIYFRRDPALESKFRNALPIRWSRTNGCWYVDDTAKNLAAAYAVLKDAGLRYELIASSAEGVTQTSDHHREPGKTENTGASAAPFQHTASLPSRCNDEELQLFRREMILCGYSKSTMRTYEHEFVQFLHAVHPHAARDFSPDRIKDYFQYCHETLRLSEHTIHSRINALKFYYERVLGREKFFFSIPRPKKPLLLPAVFSKEQVARLINSIENVKHKTLITLTYGCGLRVSEVVSLRVKDVDGQRKLLFVHRAKGKKDRVVSLSPALLVMLREYYKIYRPKVFLFEGQHAGDHLSTRSIQMVLARAKQKAGILQEGGMHALRHSFATHLLDKGIDVVFIQKLLGHNDIKTTLRYLHVTNKDLIHILSPLDDIEGLLKK